MSRITPLDEALEAAVTETFSEMAFLDAIPAMQPADNQSGQLFAIDVHGEQAHQLVLDLPLPVKQTIVENVHGCPWGELSSSDIDDCLLEFLNVLAGAFGRHYWGDESRYTLSFPRVVVGPPRPPDSPQPDSFWFDAYDLLFAIHVTREV